MANTINYAEKWARELIETFIENTYIAPFVESNVRWLDAKSFHFTQMSTSGYKAHSRLGGWNKGDVKQNDVPYTLTHDRDIQFLVDKADVDESNQTASMQNLSTQFERTQAVPEGDAYFFSKIASIAATNNLSSTTALSTYTKANIYGKVVELIGKVRRYRNKGLLVFLRPDLMDLLALSTELTHNVDTIALVEGGDGKPIETRVTQVNGVPVIEVIDDDRFYDKFDFTDGYAPVTSVSHKINMLAATPATAKYVPKIESIYTFAPGEHTEGDGYLYQNRQLSDAFVFPNGKDNKVDSVYVDVDTATA